MSLIPLQVTTSYSLLQSTITPQRLVNVAKQRHFKAVAIADRDVLYGAIEFYQAAKKAGIKPLLALRMRVAVDELASATLDLLLIARSQAGYSQLMKLSSTKMTSQDQEALSLQEFLSFAKDMYVLVEPTAELAAGNPQPVMRDGLQQLASQLGPLFLLGINLNLNPDERATIKQLANQLGIDLVALPQIDYLDDDDLFATQVLRCIASGKQLADPASLAHVKGPNYLKDAAEYDRDYQNAGLQAAVEKTAAIAKDCHVDLQFQKPVLPHFPIPDGQTAATYLRQLCLQGLKKRQAAPGISIQAYEDRLNYELQTIHEMGFDDYFLIVWDVMNFAHQAKITTGPGRGSAAGSLVAYALAITDVDPLQYQLLFERFLNPERAQMPDIDLDIPDNRRQEVLKYVHQRYGHDHVAQIITFGTLAARQVVRDVARVFKLPSYQVTQLTDALRPVAGPKTSLKDAIAKSQPLQNLMVDDANNRLLLQTAEKLEGLPRHYSTHAAGVVLSAKPLLDVVPLQKGSDEAGLLMTQFEKGPVEEIGLLKMDFLGLRNLSIMDDTVKLIRQRQPEFDLSKISLSDPATMELFRQGATDGIFQFESSGIRDVLRQLAPDRFEDIVAVNALYRPGPMANIPTYLARRHGRQQYQLPAASLAPILQPTYGVIIYQEQVMQVATVMAGFTLGQADLLRRAMSKKKMDVMSAMHDRFVKGAESRGYSPQVAEQVFQYIDRFANYGFNRSHAVAYSKMAFEMAYLKAHYAPEFFTALLSIEPNIEKEKGHFLAAKQMGVKILAPDINRSQIGFRLVNGQIITGFDLIKGMRRDMMEEIIKQRGETPFQSLGDFVNRIDESFRKAKLIEPFIYTGAFDGLGANRAEMIDGLDGLLKGSQYNFQGSQFQTSLPQRNEFPLSYRLEKEREYLGLYLSGHPVSQFADQRGRLQAVTVASLQPNQRVGLILLVGNVRRIFTKQRHEPMAFVSGSDETGQLSVTVFPKQFQRFDQLLQNHELLLVRGKTEERNGQIQLIADFIMPLKQAIAQQAGRKQQRWVIRVTSQSAFAQLRDSFRQLINAHHGNIPVVIYYQAEQTASQQPTADWLAADESVFSELKKLFGNDNVVLQSLT